MRKSYWIYPVLSIVLAMGLLLSGCGATSENEGASGSAAASQAAATGDTSPKPTSEPSASDSAESVQLTISAAASLTDALNEIKDAYEAEQPNVKLNFNFGGSGSLQQQIEQGAPADLFLSAAAKNMKALVAKGLIDEDERTGLLANRLVVIVPAEGGTAIASMADLEKDDVKNVAVGIPESVPAGNYAKEALTNAKLWDALRSKLVQAKDVRQVLQYVETGNADAGFVYKTDAISSDKTQIAFEVDPSSYTAVEYPIGIVKATKHAEEAKAFYEYLQSQAALDIFVKYGFSVANR